VGIEKWSESGGMNDGKIEPFFLGYLLNRIMVDLPATINS
jgi:hypothetical protein